MTANSDRSILLAILAGAGMISVAVYLGLRDRPTAEETRVSERSVSGQSGDVRSPFEERERRQLASDVEAAGGFEAQQGQEQTIVADSETRSAAVAAPRPSSEVAKLASVQADAMRSEIRSECWDGLPPGDDLPSSVPIVVNLSFGPDGTVLASGTAESRDARRDGVADCVGRKLHTMRIDPPGANVSVEIPIEVP